MRLFNIISLTFFSVISFLRADNFTLIESNNNPDMASWIDAVAIDIHGNAFVVGSFDGSNGESFDFDPSPLSVLNLTDEGENMFIAKFSPAGQLIWVKHIHNQDGISARDLKIDSKTQDLILTGSFASKTDFDPGPGVFELEKDDFEMYVLKLNNNGDFVWAKQIEGQQTPMGIGGAKPRGLTVDSSGNILITGSFFVKCDFDPSANQTILTPVAGNDIFVLKLNAAGNLVWVKQMGGKGGTGSLNDYEYGKAIGVDRTGNVYVGGIFTKTADFDPGAGQFLLNSAGEYDIFIAKLTASGNFVWAKRIGGGNAEVLSDLALDIADEIVFCGWFANTVDFNPNGPIFNLVSAGGNDIYVAKLDRDGNFVWAKRMGGVGNEGAYALALDKSNTGSEPFTTEPIFLTGTFNDVVDFDPGPETKTINGISLSTIFTASVDGSGNFRWAQAFQGGEINFNTPHDLASDNEGNAIVVGQYKGTVDFDPGIGLAQFADLETGFFSVKLNGRNGLLRANSAKFDFSLDTDILFQNTLTGDSEIWLMNGFQKVQGGIKIQKDGFMPSPNWRIAAVGDFNRDVHSDILMENKVTGEREIWLLDPVFPNQNKVKESVSLGTIDVNWQIAATGEFNNDGNTDIVWQNNQTGERLIWFMWSTTPFSGAFLPIVPSEWKIVGSGFFDDNERTDLVWQNTITKEKVIWTMSDNLEIQTGFSFGVAGNWEFVGTGFFNNDNRSDIILENKGTQQRVIWFANPKFNSEVKFNNAAVLPNFSTQWEIRNR
ncbi:MAG: SBBP repeat-containing protein [Verrucomicrobiae bacterium]|nr:SBBP repeat-containing protein [Verrucomicrobiae bacterium]